MNKKIKIIGLFASGFLMFSMANSFNYADIQVQETAFASESLSEISYITAESIKIKSVEPEIVEKTVEIPGIQETYISDNELRLLALVTMAEAEGECEEGKRLVIDTILNRVDSEHFPDTITDVIYQKNQFTSMWNGRVDRCHVTDDVCSLIEEELQNRTNSDVIFFRTGHYSSYGEPMFQVGNHYFSSYD